MFFPEIKPYNHFMLPVSDLHTIYVEECGNPKGRPILYVHGGPGAGCDSNSRRYFNPEKYRIILVDQRGCGRSTPLSEMRENNTQNLIADFEVIRHKLNIDQWILFGGSWGSTLSLAYAQAYPNNVSGLILRGVFLGRPQEIDWLYHYGANQVYPDQWAALVGILSEAEQANMLNAYYERLTSSDKKLRMEAADAWSVFEFSIACHHPNPALVKPLLGTPAAHCFALAECHYMREKLFLRPNQLLADIDKIQHIPTIIVHGRYDMVCAVDNAWVLKQALPSAELHIVPEGGHSPAEASMLKQLIAATNQLS